MDDQLKIISFVTNQIGENAYAVLFPDEGRAFVVDPGGRAGEIAGACADAGCKIEAILLTHGHYDHIEAVAELKRMTGADVYIGAADADMLTDARRSLGSRGWHAQCGADVRLEAPEIEVCGQKVRVLYTPGHTSGSVCYYLEEHGVLLSGDTLFWRGYGRTDLPTGSDREMYASLMALFELPPETRVLPGHGRETTIGSEAALYR